MSHRILQVWIEPSFPSYIFPKESYSLFSTGRGEYFIDHIETYRCSGEVTKRVFIDDSFAIGIITQLSGVRVPLIHEEMAVCDGAYNAIEIVSGGCTSKFSWWGPPPDGLRLAANVIYRLQGTDGFKAIYILINAHKKWWGKPLVLIDGRAIPAELVVLAAELKINEKGLWINSRGTNTGVSTMEQIGGEYRTVREPFPAYISDFLIEAYERLSKGCPDLVIWNTTSQTFRFVEVKCPKWDSPSDELRQFMDYAKRKQIQSSISEWFFEEDAGCI